MFNQVELQFIDDICNEVASDVREHGLHTLTAFNADEIEVHNRELVWEEIVRRLQAGHNVVPYGSAGTSWRVTPR